MALDCITFQLDYDSGWAPCCCISCQSHQSPFISQFTDSRKPQPLSSKWHKFDPDTAYVVCIFISLGFPYMISISHGFPFMVMLQTLKCKHHCSGCGIAMGCYGCFIVPGAAIVTSQCYGHYCFMGYVVTWAEHLSEALATWIHGNHGLSIDQWFVGFQCYLLHISVK